jgi:polyhydroxyalkanoate synthesis repressor PhaR
MSGSGEQTATDPGADDSVKVIKRYTNRKLYDTVESRYVTLEEIGEMVKGGAEVRIIDNRTKEDITSVTLTQIIFEEEKREGQMPLGVLRRIIQGGGEAVQGFITERVTPQVGKIREEAEARVGRLWKREESAAPPPPVREVFQQSQRTVEEWQRRVDEHVRSALEAVTGLPHLQRELQRLHDRLDALEKRLAEAEKRP